MNNQCEQCGGRCCVGLIEVYSVDEIFYDETLVREFPGVEYDRFMKTAGDNMHCIALKNGKCSIYNKRPTVCRQFDVGCSRCEGYRSGKLLGFKDFKIGDVVKL